MFKFPVIILFIMLCSACEKIEFVETKVKEISFNEYIIVKAVDPLNGKETYGAFKIKDEIRSHENFKMDWLLLKNGIRTMKFDEQNLQLGRGVASETIGVQFEHFSLGISKSDQRHWWLEALPKDVQNEYSTDFCITRYKELGDLNLLDFSKCDGFLSNN